MSIDIAAPFENAKYSEFDGQFIKIDENYTEVTESGVFTGEFVDGVINEFEKDGKQGALLSIRLANRESQTYVSTSITWVSYKTARYSLMAHTLMLLAYDPYIRELTVVPEVKTITTKSGKTMTVLDIPPGTVFKVVLDFDGTTRTLNNGNVAYNNSCLGIFSETGFTPLEMRDGKQEPEKLKKALERLENNQRERAAKNAAMNGKQPGGYQQPQGYRQPQGPAQWQNQPPPPPPPQNYGGYQQRPANNYQQPKPSYVQTPEQRAMQQQQPGAFNPATQKWQPASQQPRQGNVMPPPPTAGSPMPPPPPPGGFKDDNLPF